MARMFRGWMSRAWILALAATVIPACGGKGSSGGISAPGMSGRGGRGLTQDGGTGAYFEVYSSSPSDIRLLKKGSADASFSLPATRPWLGTNPRTISTDTTITPTIGATADSITGDLGGAATGLWVKAGVTLTLLPNYDGDNADGDNLVATGTLEAAYLGFSDGVIIEGRLVVGTRDQTVQADGLSPNTGDLFVDANGVLVTGTVSTAGADNAAGTDGGNGGYLQIYADGSIIIHGTTDSTGGDGDNGGTGGDQYLASRYNNFFLTGTMNSSGGLAIDAAGFGGDAGNQDVYGTEDGNFNDLAGGTFISGRELMKGGNGPAGGGSGGTYYNGGGYYLGSGLMSGAIDSSGGDATTDGDGGDAGDQKIETWGGSVRVSGVMAARGGKGAGNGDGGGGAEIYLAVYGDDTYIYNDTGAGRGLYCSGTLSVDGGDGRYGGNAGNLYFDADDDGLGYVGSNPLVLLGYSHFDLRGGDGEVNGGDGNGGNYIDHNGGSDYYGEYYMGKIVNEVAFDVSGGAGRTGYGGSADYFEIWAEYGGLLDGFRGIYNSGSITIRGGDGGTNGGDGGDFWTYDWNHNEHTAGVDVSGGSGGTDYGGDAGYIEVWSGDELVLDGWFVGQGGSSRDADGGYGDYIQIIGSMTVVRGSLNASGGNAEATAGIGGDGGSIEVIGGDVGSSFNFSGATSNGGSGNTTGNVGSITLYGIQVQ